MLANAMTTVVTIVIVLMYTVVLVSMCVTCIIVWSCYVRLLVLMNTPTDRHTQIPTVQRW